MMVYFNFTLLLYKGKLIEIARHHSNKFQVKVTWIAFSGKDRQINDRKFFFFTGCHFLQFACISCRTGRGNNLCLGRLIVQIWKGLLPWNDNSVIYDDLSFNFAQAWRHQKFIRDPLWLLKMHLWCVLCTCTCGRKGTIW